MQMNLSKNIPLLPKLVLFSTLVAQLINVNILGFGITGLSWVIPSIFSSIILIKRLPLMTFPWKIWIPWVILVVFYLILTDYSSIAPSVSPLQRTAQLLTPLLIGMACSTYRMNTLAIQYFIRLLRIAAVIIFFGSIWLGREEILMRSPTGLATQVMTSLILSIIFVNRYFFFRETKDLIIFILLSTLPILAITRTVLGVILFVIPASFSPLGFKKRILIFVALCVLANWLFYLPQIQAKMFYSGHGEISDIFVSEDFATTGRSKIWELLLLNVKPNHWLGYGTGSAETFTYKITGALAYPHNDWLLTYYDYGIFGVIIFLLSNILLILHGYSASKRTSDMNIQFLLCAGISFIIPFMLIMFTDNIMVYGSSFGNLQYTIIGLAYGALHYKPRIKIE
jgi:hypothetical protein